MNRVGPAIALMVAVSAACSAGSADDQDPDATAGGDAATAQDAGRRCTATIPSASSFTGSIALSSESLRAFSPAVAGRPGGALVAWHEAGDGASHLLYAVIAGDCIARVVEIGETMANPRRASVAATAAGYVLAYQVDADSGPAVRGIWMDKAGDITAGPETISAAGAIGAVPDVAAHGDDVVFVWSDSQAHHFARRGPVEHVDARPVGTSLIATGLINTPHVAQAADGTTHLIYADGGPASENRDVLVVSRATDGGFGTASNISTTPSLMSIDIAVAMEDDGTLNVVWVQQDGSRVDTFEVQHARRMANGSITAPQRYQTQGAQTWTPTVTPGLAAAWHLGGPSAGEIYFAAAAEPPTRILGDQIGGSVAMARSGDAFVLAFVSADAPPRLHLSRAASAPE